MKDKKPMRKKDEAGEAFYRITINEVFRNHVVAIRGDFDIPTQGFSTNKEEGRWFLSRTNDQRRAFAERLLATMQFFKLPPSILTRLEEYVLGNGNFHIFKNRGTATCEVDHEAIDIARFSTKDIGFTEELWRESGQPFVKIYISDVCE